MIKYGSQYLQNSCKKFYNLILWNCHFMLTWFSWLSQSISWIRVFCITSLPISRTNAIIWHNNSLGGNFIYSCLFLSIAHASFLKHKSLFIEILFWFGFPMIEPESFQWQFCIFLKWDICPDCVLVDWYLVHIPFFMPDISFVVIMYYYNDTECN